LFTGLLGISALDMLGLGSGMAIASYAVVDSFVSLVTLIVMEIIVKLVSLSFNGTSDKVQAMKLMTYASTPIWVVALVNWIPFLGALLSFAANVYGVYLIYLGLAPRARRSKGESCQLYRSYCSHLCGSCARHRLYRRRAAIFRSLAIRWRGEPVLAHKLR
jgi:hypothetical protein